MITSPIRTLDEMILVLSALDSPSRHTGLKSALDARHTRQETPRRDDTGAANGLAAPLTRFTLLSTRETITYRVSEQVPNIWCAWDDNDTSGKGGWGSSADEAVVDLLEVLS